MKESVKYTQQEIELNISKLTNLLEQKKLDRTELTKTINETKKQIQYWLDLDKSQLKLFSNE